MLLRGLFMLNPHNTDGVLQGSWVTLLRPRLLALRRSRASEAAFAMRGCQAQRYPLACHTKDLLVDVFSAFGNETFKIVAPEWGFWACRN